MFQLFQSLPFIIDTVFQPLAQPRLQKMKKFPQRKVQWAKEPNLCQRCAALRTAWQNESILIPRKCISLRNLIFASISLWNVGRILVEVKSPWFKDKFVKGTNRQNSWKTQKLARILLKASPHLYKMIILLDSFANLACTTNTGKSLKIMTNLI